MGTQQILLIVLSVIIVGAAVAVGIQMFNAQSTSATRQAVASDLQSFATMAISYLQTPASLGGGNNSGSKSFDVTKTGKWLGFDTKTTADNDTFANDNATYVLTISTGSLVITATYKSDGTTTSTTTIPTTAKTLADVTVAL
ncbi:MAG: hypothetical protein J7K89_09015 [Candidatus Cloacimonetes bacterium]|nr:hypothetical protein [Candidatus Cloacimonadota bacterium]